jgi:hypothetical protein
MVTVLATRVSQAEKLSKQGPLNIHSLSRGKDARDAPLSHLSNLGRDPTGPDYSQLFSPASRSIAIIDTEPIMPQVLAVCKGGPSEEVHIYFSDIISMSSLCKGFGHFSTWLPSNPLKGQKYGRRMQETYR